MRMWPAGEIAPLFHRFVNSGQERRAFDQGCIGLGEDQPPAERGCDRRDQQAVIAPRQAAGDGAARIPAEPVGDPPLAPLGLDEVATDGAREPDLG